MIPSRKNIYSVFANIFMAMAIFCSFLCTSDIHAEDFNSSQTANVQTLEAYDIAEKFVQTERMGGVCVHVTCQHNHGGMFQNNIIAATPTLYQIETVVAFYISPPEYSISTKLKRPPRG